MPAEPTGRRSILPHSPHFDAVESLHANADFHFATAVHHRRPGGQPVNITIPMEIIAVIAIHQLLFLWTGILARRVHTQ